MNEPATIEARIKKAISDLLVVPVDQIKNDINIGKLGGDSLVRVEVCMAIEDTFGIEVPDEDAEPIVTVQQWIDYVSRQPGVKA
jgi:acyl carrier protein